MPALVRIRRRAGQDRVGHLEYWSSFPDDERLRDLSSLLVPALKALVKEYGLDSASGKKEDLQKALRAYAREHSSGETWLPAPSLLDKRMPRLLPFDGKTAHPDAEIKSALSGRFKQYMEDPQLRGKLSELEDEVKDRLRTEAKSLCDHIQLRCPDLADVYVDPDVSFEHGFRGAPLRVARAAGESVGLEGWGSAAADESPWPCGSGPASCWPRRKRTSLRSRPKKRTPSLPRCRRSSSTTSLTRTWTITTSDASCSSSRTRARCHTSASSSPPTR